MTDDEIIGFFQADIDDGSDESALRIGRAIESAVRAVVLEEALKAVEGERLEDPTEHHGDLVYQRAISDCENAIRKLSKTEGKNDGL